MARIIINKGPGGWGIPIELETDTSKFILSITTGGVHPTAAYIAETLGMELVDGTKTGIKDSEVLVAVVNCGGTLRMGIYPQKGIPTINTNPISPGGPLKKYIVENLYVSGVRPENIEVKE